jgi:hypothetical protein
MRGRRATLSSLTTSWMESGTPSEGIGDPGGGRGACRGLAGPHHERRAHLASAPVADADSGKDRRARSGDAATSAPRRRVMQMLVDRIIGLT